MKKATLSTLFGLILLSLLVPGSAFAQAPASAPSPDEQSERELNRDLDAGKGCLDYKLNIVSLVDNDHRMFWKQGDCIRVHVTNNPFLFKYTLEFNEQVIKEDDPLGAFGGKFGLNVSNVNSSGSSHSTEVDQKGKNAIAVADKANAESNVVANVNSLPIDAASKYSLLMQADSLSKIQPESPQSDQLAQALLEPADKQIDDLAKKKKISKSQQAATEQAFARLESAVTTPPPPSSQIEFQVASLTESAKTIQRMMVLLTDEYRNFSRAVQERLSLLTDQKTLLDKVKTVATQLRNDANNEWACLTNARFDAQVLKLLGCPKIVGPEPYYGSISQSADTNSNPDTLTIHTLEDQLVGLARKAEPLHAKIEESLPNKTASELMDQLHAAAQDAAFHACTYKAFSDRDLDSIRTGLIAPLNSILNDGFAFGYQFPDASKKREGPFADPTSVTMTLKRDIVSPFATATGDTKVLEYTTSAFTCSGDPEDLLTNGSSYKSLADFFTDKPAKPVKVPAGAPEASVQTTANLYMRNQNKPVFTGKTISTTAGPEPDSAGGKNSNSPKTSASDAPSTVVLVQPWLFGKPRLVLSGGMSTALLTKQEFQRSMSITAGTSQTVIGYKTNAKVRTTPMLYGHAYLPYISRRHDPDAWYATFGVTANSDNKGTDPEFLFGFSRSFLQQRFFVTAGAYLGERQKLDGGLHVGDVIPSTFTGELPVTKSYHASFAFGISYRFASTKTTQDNTKQTSSGSNTKGN